MRRQCLRGLAQLLWAWGRVLRMVMRSSSVDIMQVCRVALVLQCLILEGAVSQGGDFLLS